MTAPSPIRFWFDFASPYAWFAMDRLDALAARHGRAVELRPFLLWAVLGKQGIHPPGEAPAKWDYIVRDMKRSAAFFGLPYVHPEKIPFSAHRAARLFHAIHAVDPARADRLARAILRALFAEGRDIAAPEILRGLAATHGLASEEADAAMDGDQGRALLAAAVDEAAADGVCGSPFILVDGEPFFGADRLPQIEWRLSAGVGTTPPRREAMERRRDRL